MINYISSRFFPLGIIILSFLLAIFVTFPAITTLTTHFIGDGGDSYEYSSYMLMAAKNISEGTFPFASSTFWRYPVGFDFYRSFDSILTVGMGSLLSLLFGMPTAYNLTVLLLLTFNGIASYYVFSKITKSSWLGILGMVIYGFSFYAIAKAAGHPNLLFTGGLLLIIGNVYSLITKQVLTKKDFLSLSLSFIVTALGSTEYIVIFGIFFPLFISVFRLLYKDLFKQTMYKLIHFRKESYVPLYILFGSFFVLYIPHVLALLAGNVSFPNRLSISDYLIPSLWDYILPNSYLRLSLGSIVTNTSLGSIDKVVFLGWIEILFFVFFFFSTYSKKLKTLLFTLFFIPFVFSLGYGKPGEVSFLPYSYLVGFFPFSVVVETGRFVVLFSIATTIAMLLFLKTIKDRNLFILFFSAILLGILLERAPTEFYTSQLKEQNYMKIVEEQKSNAVLDLPLDLSSRKYNMYSFIYRKPIVDGYFHFLGDGPKEKAFLNDANIWRFTCLPTSSLESGAFEQQENQKLITSLLENNINTIVVHKDEVFFHPVCDTVRARLTTLIPYSTELTPSIYQKKIEGTIYEGKPSITLFIPTDGSVNIDGVYIAPLTPAQFSLYQNGQPVTQEYSWIDSPQGGILIQPQNIITIPVKAGDTLAFYSNDTVKQTEFSIWYRFTQTGQTSLPFHPHFEKIYDDTYATIYKLQ